MLFKRSQNERNMSDQIDNFIPWAKPDYWGNEVAYVTEAVGSSWISGGPYIERLEREVGHQYCNMPYVLATSNGTTAIHLAYLAIGLKPGDEVIVPGFCFLAAANIALLCGAKPIFAEVDPETWCMTAETIEKCLTPKTKAIVPVHTYGNVCEMDEIINLGKIHKAWVIEDAAEAFGSSYKGHKAGTLADMGTFSFHATKTITTGEGGMVVTRDKTLADSMALYRSHGMQRKQFYWHDVPGHNFRLTNLQAALGCAQFERFEHIVKERKRVHKQYKKALSEMSGITIQLFSKNIDPLLWAIALKLDPIAYPQGRNSVMEQMKTKNIETRPGFVCPSMMEFYNCSSLPICEDLSQNVISLPNYPSLTENQISDICSKLKSLQK